MFFLTTMNLAYVVKEEMAIEAWTHSEFCCRKYTLKSLDDNLYIIYFLCKTVKELWKSLEIKYKIDDVGSKKFVICKSLKYTMVDS
ncbi:hypothetical protein DVH24_042821 [Malus domestica]|uniref:Uncharacterized protein n=1 Tax=Malus domestica TaxID=3750 RepID=A0A498I142_MALDO|nr:hypothetical protein DVH24_042821 [Malus domestica]